MLSPGDAYLCSTQVIFQSCRVPNDQLPIELPETNSYPKRLMIEDVCEKEENHLPQGEYNSS